MSAATDSLIRACQESHEVEPGGPLDQLLRLLSAGGGAALDAFPLRYDLSVNAARVENAQSSRPILVTGTTLNNAGSFTGAGVGNKAILGFQGHAGVPLASIASVAFEWQPIAPAEPGASLPNPYLNLVLELSPGNVKILVIDPNQAAITPALNLGTTTSPAPGVLRFENIAASNFVQVVNAFTSSAGPPAQPIVSPPVPVAAGAGPSWNNASFRWSDIVAAFPGALLFSGYTGDGGLPGPSPINTPTPAVMLVQGDSGFRRQRFTAVRSVQINGVDA